MALLLRHPALLLRRSCEICEQWVFVDDKTPKLTGNEEQFMYFGLPLARQPGCPTPCHKCPKQSKELGKRLDRDAQRIVKAVEIYHMAQGTAGVGLGAMGRDAIVRRNLGIVAEVMREHLPEQLAMSVAPFMFGGGKA